MKLKTLVLNDVEAQKALEPLVDDDHEAQEQLALWGGLCTVAEAVVTEVKHTGKSPTLDTLYEEIKRRYNQ